MGVFMAAPVWRARQVGMFWPMVWAAALACAACAQQGGRPEGPCRVEVRAELRHTSGGSVVTVPFDAADGGAAWVAAGQDTNLMFYFASPVDFQYQAHVADAQSLLVVQTLVPTTHVDVPQGDRSVYIYDVVPVDTQALEGRYSVNVGAHINVDDAQFHCTGPTDADGRLVISTWTSAALTVGPGVSSSSSSSGGSSSGMASSSSASSSASSASSMGSSSQ